MKLNELFSRSFGGGGRIGRTLAAILPDVRFVTYLLGFRVFWRTFGFCPNPWAPRTYSEWLFSRKVRTTESFSKWVDKHLAKSSLDAVMRNSGLDCTAARTLLYTTDAGDSFLSQALPRCVVKGTHGSGMNIIVPQPRKLTQEELELVASWMTRDYFTESREPSYRGVKPGIIVEEFLTESDIVPDDYKIFCIHGRVRFIQHDVGRYQQHQRALYSPAWDKLDVGLKYPSYEPAAPAPKDLQMMVSIAERLSAAHDFVRVDLYQTEQGVKFGELTFFPESGLGTFRPSSFDKEIFERWISPQGLETSPAQALSSAQFGQ